MSPSNIVEKVAEDPVKFADSLANLVQKLGIVSLIALIIVGIMLWYFNYLMRSVVETLKEQIRVLNEQNKEYQDHFLKKRRSSGQNHLGEGEKKEKEEKNEQKDTQQNSETGDR